MPEETSLYSVAQAATFLSVKPNSVRVAANRGALSPAATGPLRFSRGELERYSRERGQYDRTTPPRALSDEQIAELIGRYEAGKGSLKQSDLAKEYGVSQQVISKYIRQAQSSTRS